MLDWLSSWLRDVVAVILLAALVELLLPNERMQRYARLVTGLIILLVILTPLLRLVQGDFQRNLEAGYSEWSRQLENSQAKMPSLDEILRKAEVAAGSSQEQTVALARTQLEAGIAAAVEQETGAGVSGVDAAVVWDGKGGGVISSVVVTLAAENGSGKADSEEAGMNSTAIEEVSPVDIGVQAEQTAQKQQEPDAAPEQEALPAMGAVIDPAAEETGVPPELERRIRALVSSGWQIGAAGVQVRQEPSRNG
ncbi:stage III sporulation protein AF [Paenibacillus pasadenensis]|uniref:stage III sporulation protein AF n=1 Tax=Paenibacillus pasadenensis TaxID=217090 RepID=UPI0020403269|nr:stage III sporulation protein AF [Paenibacillus pasadenensis]